MERPSTTVESAAAESRAATDTRRRRRRMAACVGLAVVLGLALAPTALSWRPLFCAIANWVVSRSELTLDAEQSRLGWITPWEFRGLSLTRIDGQPFVTLERLASNRSLLGMATSPRNLGDLTVDSPRVHIDLAGRDDGLIGAVGGEPTESEPPAKRRDVKLQGEIHLRGAELLVRGGASQHTWSLGELNADIALTLPDNHPATVIVLAPGTPLDHVQLSPGACNDLLKFAAPHLAEVAQADGSFSLHLDECVIGLDDPRRMRVRGELVVHSAQAAPGPLMSRLAEIVGVEQLVSLHPQSEIGFHIEDGRVWHEGAEFRLGRFVVRTQGSVGFDQSLDLRIEMPMPANLLREGALREALSDQELILPVGGTLKQPQIDAKTLGQSGVQLLTQTFQEMSRRLADREPAEPDGAANHDDVAASIARDAASEELDGDALEAALIERGVEAGEALISALRKQRAKRLAERAAESAAAGPSDQGEPDQGDPGEKTSPREPRRRWRDRWRRPASEAPP